MRERLQEAGFGKLRREWWRSLISNSGKLSRFIRASGRGCVSSEVKP